MSPSIAPTRKNILGYTLSRKLGAGAYGEVWAAEAPGGLMKAVKIIHGYHDEQRAKVELSALNKVKQVRHPFLLSLERIEVVDGQLVVVTELADKCLKDVFEEYQQQRQPGIPREELLGYVRDAADALDFLAQKHGLQHLDIKPENLLLLSGHVKVADFGLVKELENVNQSVMGGMTPAYAPPELFDGKPSSASDQYSLAIVYQEMLTGERPFTGKTAAHLAAEQMRGRPNLNALPFGDQQVVAKALAKDPKLRHESCRSFVDELTFRRNRVTAPRERFVNPVFRDGTPGPSGSSGGVTDATLRGTDSHVLPTGKAAPAQKLPPWPDFPAQGGDNAALRPVLLVGIGNTATRVLRSLRQRLNVRSPDATGHPRMRWLTLDTDRKQLLEATQGNPLSALTDLELLPMPLRRPEEYRSDANLHLAWLSRRWIYNIPRSLKTEGLRPFGRLAFVDHAESFFARLTSALHELSDPGSDKPNEKTCPPASRANPPRVFVVASISGGAGSGMVIDVGYAIRTALRELGLPDDDVSGVLIHSTAPMIRDRSLSAANAFACLAELHHFTRQGFPGDPTCGLPPFEKGDAGFNRVYLVDLGNRPDDASFHVGVDDIAEYLYLNTVTRCANFFDRCRREEIEEVLELRSFGLASAGMGRDAVSDLWCPYLCRGILRSWVERRTPVGPPTADGKGTDPILGDAEIGQLIAAWAQRHHLNDERLESMFAPAIHQRLGEDAAEGLLRLDAAKSQAPAGSRETEDASANLARRLREAMGLDAGEPGELHASIQALIQDCRGVSTEIAERTLGPLQQVVLGLIDQPSGRLGGSLRTLQGGIDLVLARQAVLKAARQELRAEQSALSDSLCVGGKGRKSRKEATRLHQIEIARLVIAEFAVERSLEALARILGELQKLQQPLTLVKREIVAFIDRFPDMDAELAARLPTTGDYGAALVQELWFRRGKLHRALEQSVQAGFLKEVGGLLRICTEDNHELQRLPEVLATKAVEVLAQELKEISVGDILRRSGMTPPQILQWSRELAKNAWPALSRCGGKVRAVLGIPEATKDVSLAKLLESQERQLPTVVPATSDALVLAYEAHGIPLTSFAFDLLQDRPDCLEYAARLHTRIDVDWSKLL